MGRTGSSETKTTLQSPVYNFLTMSNVSCSFSIDNLLTLAEQHFVNITTLVGSCPNICSLPWGDGNPDLSGVGMNISYIMQAVLTILCGPLFYLFWMLRHKVGLNEDTQKRMVCIHDTFVDTSAAFSIPVAFAAAMAIKQHTPLYELYLLHELTLMQSFSLFSVLFVTSSTCFELEPYHRRRKRALIVLLYLGLQVVLSFGHIGTVVEIDQRWELAAARELINACRSNNRVYPVTVMSIKSSDYAVGITMYAVFAITCILWTWSKTDPVWRKWLHPLTIFLSLFMTGCSLKGIISLQKWRDVMRANVGADFQDDQWSFGQIIAVFLWIPLCIQMTLYVIRVFSKYVIQKFHDILVVERNVMLIGMSEWLGNEALDTPPDHTIPVVAATALPLWRRNRSWV